MKGNYAIGGVIVAIIAVVLTIALATSPTQHERTVVLSPHLEGEDCSLNIPLELQEGDRLSFSWASTSNLTFQVGVPPDFENGSPQFWTKNDTSMSGELDIMVDGKYILSWANLGTETVKLSYEYRV